MKSTFKVAAVVEVDPLQSLPIIWCQKNLKNDNWLYSRYILDNKLTFYFKNSEDATLFKLSNKT